MYGLETHSLHSNGFGRAKSPYTQQERGGGNPGRMAMELIQDLHEEPSLLYMVEPESKLESLSFWP